MGSFDPLLPPEPATPLPAVPPPAPPAPGSAPEPAAAPTPEVPAPPAAVPAPAGAGILASLKQAREALESKNLAGAMAIYEEALTVAGDRADVLVTVSGDLGVTGHARQIVELIAPRYDAQRHGPAVGINLLQAYLAVRDPQASQHVLDLLFALNRPELQERLFGFSNVIADMMLLAAEGAISPPEDAAAEGEALRIDLVSISKPIWYYGLENLPGLLPPKEGRLRRVAFGQLAVLGREYSGAAPGQPEEELDRLARGIPLWLSEMLFFSANYASTAAVATMRREQYGHFGAEWSPEHIRQLVETTEGGLDYVFTGALRQQHGDYELVLRLWEVKKFRERKAFTARWTPATADEALAQFQAQLRTFTEFTPYPAGQGLVYAPPRRLRDYAEALGAGLTLFLGEKQVLAPRQMVVPADVAARAGAAAAGAESASLLVLGLRARARRLGVSLPAQAPPLAATPVVEQARQVLGL